MLKLYKPHSGQKRIHQSNSRFNIVCFGRQSGKTTYGLNKVADRAWKGPRDGIYWYVLQTYDAAKVAFNRMMRMYVACPSAFAKKPNETELYCQFVHGPVIYFKSGKNFEDLRIETLNGAVIDEYRQQDKSLWALIIRPMLARKQGWCDILSTANGFEHFYDLWESTQGDPDWNHFQAPSTVAPWWTEAEVESAKRTLSQAEMDQEIYALFRDLTKGKAYGCYGAWNELTESPFPGAQGILHPHLPVAVAMDFNMSPMAWTLIQGAVRNHYAFDMVYIPRTVTGTQEAAEVLVFKLLQYKIKHVTLTGDATGKSNKTSAAGKTDYMIVCAALDAAKISYDIRVPEGNPPIKDRVNCFNAHLRNAAGETHFWLHPVNCAPLRKDLQRTTWKEGTGKLDPGKDNLLTHSTDGVGYYLHELDPLTLFEESFELHVV